MEPETRTDFRYPSSRSSLRHGQPPRDEIRKISARFKKYGQVGDANVFYCSRTENQEARHKQRHLQSYAGRHNSRASHAAPPPAACSDLNCSFECCCHVDIIFVTVRKVDGSDKIFFACRLSVSRGIDGGAPRGQQGFSLSTSTGDLSGVLAVPEPTIGLVPGLWTELMMGQDGFKTGGVEPSKTAKIQNPNPNFSYSANSAAPASTCVTTETVAGPVNEIQGIGGGVGGGARLTVFINGVGFEAVTGIFNVREVFGEEAVLIHASGNPVLTDEWGRILHPLQHGASYFLVNI
ncbi:uncharacterized protein A4U43_C05F28720 [Asparagus officinalis]|uniref:Uncharacterized protein n=1 Tax=Asparagus officinalis TaxID=4686 RepID=A0A5P1EXP5_ASPOF|nr:uncharacterized protein A4U43_C05F28720 [Asparagus officinalis]